MVEMRNAVSILVLNLKGRDHSEYPGVVERRGGVDWMRLA
jgi:hypothetical protein